MTIFFTDKGEQLTTFLKWAGGKEQELRHILPLLPAFQDYYEPFVGGGAVFFSIQARKKFINDKSSELVNLYRQIAEQKEAFFAALEHLLWAWQALSDLVDEHASEVISIYQAYANDIYSVQQLEQQMSAFIACHTPLFQQCCTATFQQESDNFLNELKRNLLSKTQRMKELERKKWRLPTQDVLANIESALKSAFYMHLRHLYNAIDAYAIAPAQAAAIFFFVRENAYASMFRYNQQGKFNVPYGGISYNRKNMRRKIDYMRSTQLQQHFTDTVIENMDFAQFLQQYPPGPNDFIFLDPPYDSKFSTYAQNEFTLRDQQRLADYLLCECRAQFMLVIKNTPMILDLYEHKGLHIRVFDKKYLVSFQDRNNKNAEHLLITN